MHGMINIYLQNKLHLKKKSSNEDDTYKIPDESKTYYWIIQVDNDQVYSLLSYEEFIEKKRELHIPKKLILKKVSSYEKN
ncbi:hypothetical protein BS638_05670 [Clostridium tepidum]|uniref:Uncharacterized protein n=1 Tax=Clostridium tepidum TaxID=1962263 RepID=A0A1S9IA26_9CLOT|nr:hypothetical protein BS637_08555 [Clostridium tepidum]OOO67169.1 hypothetical protein BS638_05670 [Clostridium tepidum]